MKIDFYLTGSRSRASYLCDKIYRGEIQLHGPVEYQRMEIGEENKERILHELAVNTFVGRRHYRHLFTAACEDDAALLTMTF